MRKINSTINKPIKIKDYETEMKFFNKTKSFEIDRDLSEW